METRSKSNGLQTFLEHWGLLVPMLLAGGLARILMFFFDLKGKEWIYFFAAAMTLLISGAALIGYAKIPAYRSGRFFTFGIKSVPEQLAGCYRWGWRIFLFGVVLSLCLLLSRQ
jgi:hypothetical protein